MAPRHEPSHVSGRYLLLWLAALLLAACARQPVLPDPLPDLTLPLQFHVQQHDGAEVRDSILVVQQEGDGWRWSWLDPLGVPQARQMLHDGQWRADGLLPPNPHARELFAALLFALTPDAQLAQLYAGRDWNSAPGHRTLRIDSSSAWQVYYAQDGQIHLDVGPSLTYGVAPLDTTGASAP